MEALLNFNSHGQEYLMHVNELSFCLLRYRIYFICFRCDFHSVIYQKLKTVQSST